MTGVVLPTNEIFDAFQQSYGQIKALSRISLAEQLCFWLLKVVAILAYEHGKREPIPESSSMGFGLTVCVFGISSHIFCGFIALTTVRTQRPAACRIATGLFQTSKCDGTISDHIQNAVVVIPSLVRKGSDLKSIQKALLHLTSQRCRPKHIVIVDDGSPRSICKEELVVQQPDCLNVAPPDKLFNYMATLPQTANGSPSHMAFGAKHLLQHEMHFCTAATKSQSCALHELFHHPCIENVQSADLGWSNLHLITLTQNCGPAAARNRGIEAAHQLSASIVLFMDADCYPSDSWVAAMVEAQVQQPAIYSGLTLSSNTHHPVGRYHDQFGTLNGRLETPGSSCKLLYGCTCNLSVHRDVFNVLHFDESFPQASFEDVEFCYRARAVGIPVLACPAAVMYHQYQCSAWGLMTQFEKYGKFEPLMTQRHPQYLRDLWKSADLPSCGYPLQQL